LRLAGARCEIAFEGKLKRAMELANKLGARYTLIVGDNEINAGMYSLKNMTTGEQVTVSREDLADRILGGAGLREASARPAGVNDER
jgi:histidyl-tRNA synthetase